MAFWCFVFSLGGFIFTGYKSCVNECQRACSLCGLVMCIFGLLLLVSGVVLGPVDCSVCRSFVEIVVHLCVLNVWATWPSLLMLQDFSLKYRFQL